MKKIINVVLIMLAAFILIPLVAMLLIKYFYWLAKFLY